MSKTLSEAGDHPADGKFEVITFLGGEVAYCSYRPAGLNQTGDRPSYTQYQFSTRKHVPYQIDGEVKNVESDTTITIDSVHHALAILG